MFDVMTITRKGLELLAQATAANKLVIVGCDATADFTDAATAATTSARPANPLASTTEVTILSASNTSVFTRAAFIAGTSTGGGQAKSFFLYGHSANDTAHDYVICVASTNISVHIPLPGELINTYGLEFETVYSGAGDTVTVTGTANYCTLAEFNVLKERTVTTHKEGDDTAGDDQTIRGLKTFEDGLNFKATVNAFGHVNVMYTGDAQIGSLEFDGLYFTDRYNAAQNNPPLSCFQSSVTSVGTGASQSVAILAGDTSGFNNVGIHLRYQSNSLNDPDDTNVRIRIGNDDVFIAGYYDEFIWNACYIPRLKVAGLTVQADNGALEFREDSSIRFWKDSNTMVSDSPGNLYRKTNANAEADGKLKLSKMDGTQDQLYIAEAATHAKPNTSVSNNADCPIGSIVYAKLYRDIQNSGTVNVGVKFFISAGKAVVACISSSGWDIPSDARMLPEGYYKALHAITFDGTNTMFSQPVLIQRVADDAT